MNALPETAPAFVKMAHQIVWDLFLNGPEPVGYDPKMVPAWTSPTVDAFATLKLEPWRLRVFPGTVLMGQGGAVLTWKA